MTRRISLYILSCTIYILLLFVTSCSSPTASKSGTLTGMVALVNDTKDVAKDPKDLSGVTVALYKQAALDTTLVRLNEEYPNIGVIVSQETEFDHRLQSPVKIAVTTSDGTFKVKSVPLGTYNVVVFKAGWGVRYIYNVEIEKGTNTLDSSQKKAMSASTSSSHTKSGIELYPEQILNGYIVSADTLYLKPYHSYIIDNDAFIVSDVFMHANANIWVKPGSRLKLLTSLAQSSPNNGFTRISSSDQMYSVTKNLPSQILRFDSVLCSENIPFEGGKLHSVITSFCDNGWEVLTSYLDISDMILRYCGIGLQISQKNYITVSDCNIYKADHVDRGTISFTGCNHTILKDIIFYANKIGVKQHSSDYADIQNCYFSGNTTKDVMNFFETKSSVSHCIFTKSKNAIETSGNSNTITTYCYIESKLGIYNLAQVNWLSSEISANFNNFNCSEYNIKTQARYQSSVFPPEYNCENNYWYTSSEAEIAAKIWDRNDEDSNDPIYSQYKGIVDFKPYKNSRISTVGITTTK